MGLRAVSDLEEYTIAELVELIDKASTLLRQKVSDSGASSAASVISYSTVDEAESAGAGASSSDPAGGLKSPFECEYHCKFCFSRCCRPPLAHKNHACLEHRHRR